MRLMKAGASTGVQKLTARSLPCHSPTSAAAGGGQVASRALLLQAAFGHMHSSPGMEASITHLGHC